MFNLVTVYRMVTSPEYAATFGPGPFAAQVDLLLHMFRYDYSFSIAVLFSIHLILIGYLIVRSRYMPAWLGAILVINGFGRIIGNLRPYLYPQAGLGWLFITSFGELVFMLWLLIRGWRLEEPRAFAVA